MDRTELAPRELRICMAALDRHFYQGRELSALACQCLINDSVRHALLHKYKPSWRAARPGRVELIVSGGRRIVA